MSISSWQDNVRSAVRTPQIVVVGLVLGCLVFMGVVLSVPMQPAAAGDAPVGPGAEGPMMTYMAMGFVLLAILARVVVVPLVVATIRRKIAEGTWPPEDYQAQGSYHRVVESDPTAGKLAILYLMKTIIGGAIIEGAAFFLLVAYMMEASPLSIGLAVVLVVLLALHFPTAGGMISWIEQQLDELRMRDQFGAI